MNKNKQTKKVNALITFAFTHGKSQMSIELHNRNTVIINVIIVIVELEAFEMPFRCPEVGLGSLYFQDCISGLYI